MCRKTLIKYWTRQRDITIPHYSARDKGEIWHCLAGHMRRQGIDWRAFVTRLRVMRSKINPFFFSATFLCFYLTMRRVFLVKACLHRAFAFAFCCIIQCRKRFHPSLVSMGDANARAQFFLSNIFMHLTVRRVSCGDVFFCLVYWMILSVCPIHYVSSVIKPDQVAIHCYQLS